ncbi:extracellular solute-binding protein [Paenibacillus qinlingensis]|uniref:Aldouronate transport system substrate-binding protein n=1 Tax=Paenibacillus qinlingensis TaxID=1837343 RepID=A0ABU1NXQ8_9BACL|nr:extracellular solute-binding protein [Paenibacillus qinlingensis]MDR6552281.1 putative aldouronate transport system substrate-binding protein [Paenibacillus qinlingensis]
MQRKKITFTVLAAVVGLGTLLSACGSQEEVKPAASSSTQTEANKFANKIKISMFNQGTFNAAAPIPPREEDIQRQMLEKAMNIDLDMTIPQAGQATTKLNTLIAGGDIPDLLFLKSRSDLAQYYDQGVLADLTPYLDQFPELKKRFAKDSWEATSYQGKTIGIPGYDNVNGISRSFFIRNDWLKKLGLKVPTTPDELFEVMKAFTEKDPDGNGKNDTYGFIGGMNKEGNLQTYGFDSLMWMFGVNPPSAIDVKDNKPVYLFIDPKMKEALAYINKMMTAKVVDPDWVTMNTPDLLDQKLFKGKVGFMIRDARRLEPDYQQKMKEIGGEVPEWIVIPPMKGPYGDQIVERKSFQGNSWAISKKADKEKITRILSMLEYMFTDKEAYPYFAYGVKGIQWDIVDGKVKNKNSELSKEVKEKYLWVDHYRMPRRGDDAEYFSFQNPKTAEAFTNNQQYVGLTLPGNLLTADPSDSLAADRTRFINESLVKFMSGKDPLTNWDNFLKTLDTKFDMQKYKDTAVKQFKEAGLIK